MKKKIAVFIGEIRSEFQNSVLSSIYDRAEQLGYLVFVFAVYGAYGNSVLYSEGERAIVYLPDLKEFDGIIVAAGTFNITGMDAELEKRILETAACPVVYLRGTGEDFYNIQIDDEPAMEEMTEHFINVHGFRDICFMQGIMSMEDGKKRYQGFLNAMQKAEIPVTEHMVFEGNFWKDKGEEAVSWFMEGRETYPQAIICANDFMAISVCEELEKRGIHVPEDVCVSGYDNLTTAQHFRPSITSLDVRFQKMGITAVDIIDRKRNNQEQKRVVKVRPKLILHRSCGCGKQEIEDDGYQLQNILNMQNARIFHAMMMLSESQDADTDAECERIIEGYFRETNAKKGYLCLCMDEEDERNKKEPYSEQMLLDRICYADREATYCREVFDRREILPAHCFEENKEMNYVIYGIHCKSKCFGYFVMVYDRGEFNDTFTQVYLMEISRIMDAVNMNREIVGLKEIRELYLKDPLTGIYNRRGFDKQLRALESEKKLDHKYLSIVSIDMDGLKYINDKFGHAEGDVALCRLAHMLEELLTEDEVCARVGGDEYVALLVAGDEKRGLSFAASFAQRMEQEFQEEKMPYPFRASIGVYPVENIMELMESMRKADEEMYKNKREHKAGIGIR